MYCIYCGQQLPDEANFCWKCGKPVISAAKGQPSASPESPTASQLLSAIKEPHRYGYNLVMVDCGPKKIETIKVIRQLTNWGLVEAKNCAETPNSIILRDVTLDMAEAGRRQLEAAGAYARVE